MEGGAHGGLPNIVGFRGLNGPLLPQNPLEKVGGEATPPTFGRRRPFRHLKPTIFGNPPLGLHPIKDLSTRWASSLAPRPKSASRGEKGGEVGWEGDGYPD